MSGEVDKKAWGRIVSRLVDEECRGNKSAFARRVIIDGRPISPRTAYGWINGEYEVKESSVRAVAVAFERNAVEMLIEVGVYRRDQIPQLPDDTVDDEQLYVLDDDELDDETKRIILEELETWRAADQQVQQQLADRDKRTRRARLEALISQTKRGQ